MSDIEATVHAVAAVVARSRRVRANIEKAIEAVKVYLPGDDVELTFARAICHPLLGGILRKEEKDDLPGPSFTINSLRRAAKKGELRTSWNGDNRFTTGASLRDWVALRAGERTPAKASVRTYKAPGAKTRFEKQKGAASISNASAKLIALNEMLAKKKKGDK